MKLYPSLLPWILLLTALTPDLLIQILLPRFLAGYDLRRDPPSDLLRPESRLRKPYCAWLGILCAVFGLETLTLADAFVPVSFGWCVPMLVGYGLYTVFLAIAAFSPREGERKRGGKLRKSEFSRATLDRAPFLLIPGTVGLGVLLLLDGRVLPGVLCLVLLLPQIGSAVLSAVSLRKKQEDGVFSQPGLWLRQTVLFGYLPLYTLALHVLFTAK